MADSPKKRRAWVPWIVAGLVGIVLGIAMGAGTAETPEPKTVATTVSTTVTETKQLKPSKAALRKVRKDVAAERRRLTRVKSDTADEREKLSSLESQVATAEAGRFDGEGTFAVGDDIEPGTYRAEASPGCYWARLNSLDTSDIVDNDNADGPVVVSILPSDAAFTASGCGEFVKSG